MNINAAERYGRALRITSALLGLLFSLAVFFSASSHLSHHQDGHQHSQACALCFLKHSPLTPTPGILPLYSPLIVFIFFGSPLLSQLEHPNVLLISNLSRAPPLAIHFN